MGVLVQDRSCAGDSGFLFVQFPKIGVSEPVLSRRQLLGTVGGLLASSVAGCSSPVGTGPQKSLEDTPTPELGSSDSSQLSDLPSSVAEVYQETIDSVVMIRVYTDRWGQGSGFVFRSPQYLLTNQHVVANATQIEIRYSRGDWRTAEIVGTDYYSDLAVLEVEQPPAYAEPLSLVKQDPPIGSHVVAIGTPFGLEKTISSGIVSGVDRSIDVNFNQPGGFSIPDAVQTDAALNPGNSGGPLLTLDGKVIGIVRAGQGDNIGFGISAALARRVGTALIENGTYEHSYMGVTLAPVTPTIADANDLEEISGVIVTSVLDDGPSNGVLEGSRQKQQKDISVPVGGDVIIDIEDTPIDTLTELSIYLALETSPGDTIAITVLRDGSHTTVDLTLGTRPEPPV